MKRLTLMIVLALALFALSPMTSASLAAPDTTTATDSSGDYPGGKSDKKSSVIEKPKQGILPGLTAIVLFLIVFGILKVKVWPMVSSGLDERNEKIVGEIAAAEDARKQAKDALNEYEKNLADARAQAQQMLEDTKATQIELAAQLKSRAEAELNEMREKAKAEINAAKKQAIDELYSESVNLATVMAGKILQREVSVQDEQRLMEESLAELKTVNS
ncbi:MAG: F0F1 ATP synthase subunit B [Phycisphaerales bacterium]|nr:F0F1 ATP synthase subunit B [Phycisphaerales bacterium]